jgi:hypothetical protein
MGRSVSPWLVAANARAWTPVELTGPPPPPRYGHSLVSTGGGVVAYAGERSSFVLGRAVQVDPMVPKLKAPGSKRLKLAHENLL